MTVALSVLGLVLAIVPAIAAIAVLVIVIRGFASLKREIAELRAELRNGRQSGMTGDNDS